ncbi:MAG: hypothetical protein LBV19_02600 [Streptococcaceae bacterium]|jgi:hypothetical protein|nr:hypothetical protein [Streptococcaceae bacterium]
MNLFQNLDGTLIDSYNAFSNWLDGSLSEKLPDEIMAVNFNLYESCENEYCIEFVGCSRFDAQDDDWACDEVFATREHPYLLSSVADDVKWEEVLALAVSLIMSYLSKGRFSGKLKKYKALAIGFVDGDLEILYSNIHF